MISFRTSFIGALFIVAAGVSRAQQPSTPPGFAPLELLVGSCWRGTFPDGKQTDEHCFEWVFDRKFVRDRHVVRGGPPYAGETIYFWDPASKHVAFSYWNTQGQMMNGRIESAAGDTIVFSTLAMDANPANAIRSTWTRVGADRYRTHQFQRAGDGWKELFSVEFSRTK